MAHPSAVKPPPKPNAGQSNKRKEPPTSNNNAASKKQKVDHRARQRDARALSTQTTSKAFVNGALDIDAFVKAREFEMRALDSSMQRSKKALNRRAFQQVPKELRRRTASHNVKRIPKRLRERGKKEMAEDNTPTVSARKRKPTRHMRLRLETVKRLRALGAQKKAAVMKTKGEQLTVIDPNKSNEAVKDSKSSTVAHSATLTSRKAKVKKANLVKPPKPKAKFRKRQIHKSWLPTHMFHAKRAHMTPPSEPLWRFAIPLTPTQKSYRPTHRASHERGAIAWDTSYMATIGLEGEQKSVEGLLRALGVGRSGADAEMWSARGEKWRNGTRVLETFALEREAPHRPIAPMTVVWCAASPSTGASTVSEKRKRKLFLRVHPLAFFQLWEEVVRLAKVAKPAVAVEDLRFEVGSIEIAGPGSTEALLGALWPADATDEASDGTLTSDSDSTTWRRLAGVTDPSTLPSGACLNFTVQDPRLHHPPRTIKLPHSSDEHAKLLEMLSTWPSDESPRPGQIFDRKSRWRGSKLSSQKAINRRKSLAKPGDYPSALPTDPQIPVLLYTRASSTNKDNKQKAGRWTLLAPWKCIQPVWYSLMYYPLSTGQQPRFGGLREQRQLAFENDQPWFPADYPGTKAGWEWEVTERKRRCEEWKKRPKGKRVSFEKVDLGNGKKGEVGEGWSCDWSVLFVEHSEDQGSVEKESTVDHKKMSETSTEPLAPVMPRGMSQIAPGDAASIMEQVQNSSAKLDTVNGQLALVRIKLLRRGVPETCARIYRLPSADTTPELRKSWIDLAPDHQKQQGQKRSKRKHSLPKLSKDVPPHVAQRRLAQSLLQTPRAGEAMYPACPGVDDLIGFVTTGSFNLAEGQGTGIGSILLDKVVADISKSNEEGKLCIVRNAGANIGRLARWEIVA